MIYFDYTNKELYLRNLFLNELYDFQKISININESSFDISKNKFINYINNIWIKFKNWAKNVFYNIYYKIKSLKNSKILMLSNMNEKNINKYKDILYKNNLLENSNIAQFSLYESNQPLFINQIPSFLLENDNDIIDNNINVDDKFKNFKEYYFYDLKINNHIYNTYENNWYKNIIKNFDLKLDDMKEFLKNINDYIKNEELYKISGYISDTDSYINNSLSKYNTIHLNKGKKFNKYKDHTILKDSIKNINDAIIEFSVYIKKLETSIDDIKKLKENIIKLINKDDFSGNSIIQNIFINILSIYYKYISILYNIISILENNLKIYNLFELNISYELNKFINDKNNDDQYSKNYDYISKVNN